jgi:hypothetical protein
VEIETNKEEIKASLEKKYDNLLRERVGQDGEARRRNEDQTEGQLSKEGDRYKLHSIRSGRDHKKWG